MTDERKRSLLALKSRIAELNIELRQMAHEEYKDKDWFSKDTAEYDEIVDNSASLEDAASFLKDALDEIDEAI